jgi:hypothetical protein
MIGIAVVFMKHLKILKVVAFSWGAVRKRKLLNV